MDPHARLLVDGLIGLSVVCSVKISKIGSYTSMRLSKYFLYSFQIYTPRLHNSKQGQEVPLLSIITYFLSFIYIRTNPIYSSDCFRKPRKCTREHLHVRFGDLKKISPRKQQQEEEIVINKRYGRHGRHRIVFRFGNNSITDYNLHIFTFTLTGFVTPVS